MASAAIFGGQDAAAKTAQLHLALQQQALLAKAIDPAITAALAKAQAAAMATCTTQQAANPLQIALQQIQQAQTNRPMPRAPLPPGLLTSFPAPAVPSMPGPPGLISPGIVPPKAFAAGPLNPGPAPVGGPMTGMSIGSLGCGLAAILGSKLATGGLTNNLMAGAAYGALGRGAGGAVPGPQSAEFAAPSSKAPGFPGCSAAQSKGMSAAGGVPGKSASPTASLQNTGKSSSVCLEGFASMAEVSPALAALMSGKSI